MTYMILSIVLIVALLSCVVIFYLYVRKLKEIIYIKDGKINELNITVGYAEEGLSICNKKINSLKSEVVKLKSDNKILTEKISKLNSQFKNVTSYLKDN